MNRLKHIVVAWLAISTVSVASTYQIDDGSAETALGPFQGETIAWLNSFQVTPGAGTLTSIDIVLKPFGPDSVVHPLTVYLWTDPTNDGNPSDAVVARSVNSTTSPVGSFVTIPIVPLSLPAGSWFFAGGLYTRPADAFDAAPVAADMTAPTLATRSFFAIWDSVTVPKPNSLSLATIPVHQDPDENYLVRVNAIPEPSGLILAALGQIGFAAWGWRIRRGSVHRV